MGRRLALIALLLAALPCTSGAARAGAQATTVQVLPGVQATTAQAEAGTPSGADAEMWLSFQWNRQGPADTVLVLRRAGRLMVRAEDLQRWRLRLPDVAPLAHGGDDWFPLDALAGLRFTLDEARQALDVATPAALFQSTALSGEDSARSGATPSAPGAFFNYDVTLARSAGQNVASGLFELAGFNRFGSATSTLLAPDLGQGAHLIRLDSSVAQDRPTQRASLRIGDTIGAGAAWSHPVRYAGLQWASNFATDPGLISYPQPGMHGEAVVPSTLDVYVNDALRLHRDVPAGPFSITDIPVVTGQGELRMVLRDLLGREQVISAPYYASARFLRPGLHEFSYEAGALRRNYGVASNDYGRFAASATERVGISEQLTGELHAEVLRAQQTLGLAGSLLAPAVGVFTAALAASRGNAGSGALGAAGFERLSRAISVGANLTATSARFRQLGFDNGRLPPITAAQAFASLPTSRFGSFALSYLQQRYREREPVRLLSASYTRTLGSVGFLSASLLRSLGPHPSTAIGINFTRALSQDSSVSANANSYAGARQATVQLQRNLPAGSGFGYRLMAEAGAAGRREAALSAQSDVGGYTLEAARLADQTSVRVGATGGVALLAGAPFLGRRMDQSFGVARITDYPNVRVYADNQVVAHTDAKGLAFLPHLRAYQKNAIRIEQADLPMDAQIETMQIDAVPYLRSGLVLDFPVTRSRGALITILLEDGQPIPAGATVQVEGDAEQFPVGLRGEAYLLRLSANNRLLVTWRGQRCSLAAPLAPTSEALPHLGSFTCKGVQP